MDYPQHLALVACGHRPEGVDGKSLEVALSASLASLAGIVEDIFTRTPIRLFSFYDILLEEQINRGLSPPVAEETKAFITDWSLPEEVRLILMGNPRKLPPELARAAEGRARQPLSSGGRGILWFMGYGGREEIVEAVKLSAEKDSPEERPDGFLERHLLTARLPDPDLLVLTGGLRLLPDFMIYQVSYSEIYFSPRPWTAFGFQDLEKALDNYRVRDRRYGKV